MKTKLGNAQNVFILGSSLRGPTIASILEEVLREKYRKDVWIPFSSIEEFSSEEEAIEDRLDKASETKYRIFLIDRNPINVTKYLEDVGYFNLSRALIPIKVTIPSAKKEADISEFVSRLIEALKISGLLERNEVESIFSEIKKTFGVEVTVLRNKGL